MLSKIRILLIFLTVSISTVVYIIKNIKALLCGNPLMIVITCLDRTLRAIRLSAIVSPILVPFVDQSYDDHP